MTAPPSLRAGVLLLAVASVATAQVAGALLLLVLPILPPSPTFPGQVAAAVREPSKAAAARLRVRVQVGAPFLAGEPGYARPVAAVLQSLLSGTGVREVRVHALADAVALRAPGAPPPVDALRRPERSESIRTLAVAPFPPFATAVLQPDGRWLVVEPVQLLPAAQLRVLMAFALSLVLVAPVAWWSAHRLTRSLRRLEEASRALQRDPGMQPLPVEGPSEVQSAISAFNAMLAAVAQHVDERSTLAAAVAHDLRTPLTGLRIRAERASDDLRERLISDIDRMDVLTAQLLEYARGSRASAPRRTFNLTDLVETVASEARLQRFDVTVIAAEPAAITAEPGAIRRALENLVHNAGVHAGPARLRVWRTAGWAWVAVRDDGPGLPSEALESAFQPFVQFEQGSRSTAGGSGLGLAIARGLIRAHGGEVQLFRCEPRGTEARLRLPLSGSPELSD